MTPGSVDGDRNVNPGLPDGVFAERGGSVLGSEPCNNAGISCLPPPDSDMDERRLRLRRTYNPK